MLIGTSNNMICATKTLIHLLAFAFLKISYANRFDFSNHQNTIKTPNFVDKSAPLRSSPVYPAASEPYSLDENGLSYQESSFGSDTMGAFESISSFTKNYRTELSQANKDVIFEGLKKLYKKKVLPLEMASKYAHFGSPPMSPSDFDAKPMVLVLGQYSVGKTSFTRSLLRQDFPGQRIGPEPTTDRFTAIMHSADGMDRTTPGHALVMQPDKPFRGLASFGNSFLTKFEGVEVSSSILRNITIIDTPGVLAGEKQRIGRDYDYAEVIKWFADRADLIIIMFDAHKLDISDELKSVLDAIKPHQEKIRILLNKADSVDGQALLRVYGALMWSLGKVIKSPEACRVYLGSFWEAPLKLQDNRVLLDREKRDLLEEIIALPQNAIVRRINELVKRARSVKVHAYIIHYLRKQMPYLLGKADKQRTLIDGLEREFHACARRYNLPWGDFPNVDKFRHVLREIEDISDFKKLDKSLVREMDKMLTVDIPQLLQQANAGSGGQNNNRIPTGLYGYNSAAPPQTRSVFPPPGFGSSGSNSPIYEQDATVTTGPPAGYPRPVRPATNQQQQPPGSMRGN